EVMFRDNDFFYIYSFAKQPNGDFVATKIHDGGFPNRWHDVMLADFNGDGKTDLLTDNGSLWETAISNGKSFIINTFNFNRPPSTSPANFGDGAYDRILLGDYNGDGKTDILQVYGSTPGQVTIADINVYYSKGNEFYRVDDTWNTGGAGIGLLAQVESNGDGKTDIISQSTILSTANVTTLFFNKESLANLLAQVADGLGNVNMFGYEPLTTSTNYTKGTNAQYPLVDVKAPLYVAAYHQAPN